MSAPPAGSAPSSAGALSAEQALRDVLTAMAGPEATPRADQLEAVEALVTARRRVLLVQATGWGKSAVYWAATAARRSAGAGPTLVISPLLALVALVLALVVGYTVRAVSSDHDGTPPQPTPTTQSP